LDNNLTRKVSLSDPLQIVELKGLAAGPVNVGLGLWMGGKLPGIPTIVAAGMVGFLGYGVSLVAFVIALRHLGSAGTSAYFSTAPFFGATAAILALGEPVTLLLVIAGALMGLGVWLHVSERHQHTHDHEPIIHSHVHTHDEHHQHAHGSTDPPSEPHVHEHRHAALVHTHPHMPDMHHQHRH
jgi:ABC-type nickel/cobalt efflux system permease component RcnA